jgi:hypothetical protein
MKKKLFLSISIVFIAFTSVFSQGFTKPAEGKSVIYIIHKTVGFSTNMIFDGNQFIGNLKTSEYMRYECDQGKHIFIGAIGVNKDFFTADFEVGKIYIIRMRSQSKLGGTTPYFVKIDLTNTKKMAKYIEFVNSKAPAVTDVKKIKKWNKKWKKLMQKALAKYESKWKHKRKYVHISKDMNYK